VSTSQSEAHSDDSVSSNTGPLPSSYVHALEAVPFIPVEDALSQVSKQEGHPHPEYLEEHVADTREVLAVNS